mmetsp:Transcript_19574/g.40583  ORF Transcript_19574/g.40583 Transcript_19574/m.40583 type:complete len:203 (-) Transcript_19574:263-871(-)
MSGFPTVHEHAFFLYKAVSLMYGINQSLSDARVSFRRPVPKRRSTAPKNKFEFFAAIETNDRIEPATKTESGEGYTHTNTFAFSIQREGHHTLININHTANYIAFTPATSPFSSSCVPSKSPPSVETERAAGITAAIAAIRVAMAGKASIPKSELDAPSRTKNNFVVPLATLKEDTFDTHRSEATTRLTRDVECGSVYRCPA